MFIAEESPEMRYLHKSCFDCVSSIIVIFVSSPTDPDGLTLLQADRFLDCKRDEGTLYHELRLTQN